MSIEKVLEQVDAIEAKQDAKIAEAKQSVEAVISEKVDAVRAETEEKLAAIVAKLSEIGATPTVKTYKTVSAEVNRSVKEQLRDFYKNGSKLEKEIKMFADEGH